MSEQEDEAGKLIDFASRAEGARERLEVKRSQPEAEGSPTFTAGRIVLPPGVVVPVPPGLPYPAPWETFEGAIQRWFKFCAAGMTPDALAEYVRMQPTVDPHFMALTSFLLAHRAGSDVFEFRSWDGKVQVGAMRRGKPVAVLSCLREEVQVVPPAPVPEGGDEKKNA